MVPIDHYGLCDDAISDDVIVVVSVKPGLSVNSRMKSWLNNTKALSIKLTNS